MGPTDTRQALTDLVEQLKDEDLVLRLRNFEDAFVERKTASDSQDWLRTAVAFANSTPIGYPAVLFIGVKNDGEPEAKTQSNLESLQKTFSTRVQAAYPPIFYYAKVLTEKNKQFLAVIIPGSPDRPHFAGSSYVRVGPETKEASAAQFDTLIAQRQSKAYEISKWVGKTIIVEYWKGFGHSIDKTPFNRTLVECNAFYVTHAADSGGQQSIPLRRVEVSFDSEKRVLKLEIRSE